MPFFVIYTQASTNAQVLKSDMQTKAPMSYATEDAALSAIRIRPGREGRVRFFADAEAARAYIKRDKLNAFDVYQALSPMAAERTTIENVQDVLDAIKEVRP